MSKLSETSSDGFAWEMPEEEVWVRQVMLDVPQDINKFMSDAATDKTIRGVTIITCNTYGRVLITFERNINAKAS